MKSLICNRLFVLLAIFCLSGTRSWSQQLFSSSLTPTIMPLVNPAFTGYDIRREVTVGYKKTWLGIDNSPSTAYALGQTTIHKEEENELPRQVHGLGAIVVTDAMAGLTRTYGQVQYALHQRFFDHLRGSLGVSVGLSNWAYKSGNGVARDPNDPQINAFSSGRLEPILGIGGLISYQKLVIGFGLQHWAPGNVKLAGAMDVSPLATTRYITLGFNQLLPGGEWSLEPLLNLRATKGAPVSADFYFRAVYKSFLTGGLGFRTSEAVPIAMVGVRYQKYRFRYAYDQVGSQNGEKFLQKGTSSHEINVSIQF